MLETRPIARIPLMLTTVSGSMWKRKKRSEYWDKPWTDATDAKPILEGNVLYGDIKDTHYVKGPEVVGSGQLNANLMPFLSYVSEEVKITPAPGNDEVKSDPNIGPTVSSTSEAGMWDSSSKMSACGSYYMVDRITPRPNGGGITIDLMIAAPELVGDGYTGNTKMTIPKSTVEALFLENEADFIDHYEAFFKVEAQEPGDVRTDRVNGGFTGYLTNAPITISQSLVHSATVELEVSMDGTGQLYVGVPGGDAEAIEPLSDDGIYELALQARKDYDEELSKQILLVDQGVINMDELNALRGRPPATANKQLKAEQRKLMDEWWSHTQPAAFALIDKASKLPTTEKNWQEAVDKGTTSDTQEDWVSGIEAAAGVTAGSALNGDKTAKEAVKKAGQSIGDKVADYVTSYSPDDWVTAGLKGYGGTKVIKSLGDIPPILLWGGAAVVALLVLKDNK